jgi:hypothetical protein
MVQITDEIRKEREDFVSDLTGSTYVNVLLLCLYQPVFKHHNS